MNNDPRRMFFSKDMVFTDSDNKSYEKENLIFNVTEDILIAMETHHITKVELAKKLNKSKSFVTQILSGKRNLTLKTLSDICHSLNMEAKISLISKGN